ncbi:hypothetical protein BB561_002097 [Smittium simulii]|uniref:Uncharacterized protein n=1 Tax=Smittium simulii TaxID=133385 RepID=A0A2T9YRS7_9FUNG|nr:hypothetical protein BB561_002097 [Smittium simulii]
MIFGDRKKTHWKTRNAVPTQEQVDKFRRRIDLLAKPGGVYVVLIDDFGDKPHVFSGVRKIYHNTINSFWSLSPQEKKELEDRGSINSSIDKNL